MFRNRIFWIIAIAVCITAILFVFSVIDPEPEQPTITIRGEKPEGSHVVLWASYYIGGEQCDKYTFSALDMKEHKGGIERIKYTNNLSDSPSKYSYRIRYQNYNDDRCQVVLDSITLKVYNIFDSKRGFAELNLSNIKGNELYQSK